MMDYRGLLKLLNNECVRKDEFVAAAAITIVPLLLVALLMLVAPQPQPRLPNKPNVFSKKNNQHFFRIFSSFFWLSNI